MNRGESPGDQGGHEAPRPGSESTVPWRKVAAVERREASALRTARRAFMMFLLSERATRSTYTGASSVESNSAICRG